MSTTRGETPAERLRSARLATGYSTAADAARANGWKLSGYRHHENGTAGFARQAATYAQAFGVTPEWLLYGRGGARTSGAATEAAPATTRPSLDLLGDDDRPTVFQLVKLVEETLDHALETRIADGQLSDVKAFSGATSKDQIKQILGGTNFDTKILFALMIGFLPAARFDHLQLLAKLVRIDDAHLLEHPEVAADVRAFIATGLRPGEAPLDENEPVAERRVRFLEAAIALVKELLEVAHPRPHEASARRKQLR